MSLINFAGNCDFCGNHTPAFKGDFQSIGSLGKKEKQLFVGQNYKGKWLIRCFKCKGVRFTKKYNELLNMKLSNLKGDISDTELKS